MNFYDLHIHSCLSPCADDDMTPQNIAAMARLKELTLVALTDHNCAKNLTAFASASEGLSLVPGIEVTSSEEVHVLAYFDNIDAAEHFGELVYDSLPDIANRPEIFGNQIIMDIDDSALGQVDKLLLSATNFSLEEIKDAVWQLGGCAVPAHINRESFSVLSNLGFLPPGLFKCVEVSLKSLCPPIDPNLFVLNSSDAHRLEDISEPIHSLANVFNAADFIQFLRNL